MRQAKKFFLITLARRGWNYKLIVLSVFKNKTLVLNLKHKMKMKIVEELRVSNYKGKCFVIYV